MNVLNNLKQKAKLAENDEKKEVLEHIESIEEKIATMVAKQNSDKVFNNLGMFAQNNGSLNTNGMWAVKRKVFPKNPKESLFGHLCS